MRAQSHPTLCNPTDCSPPCNSVHGIFQARILGGLSFPTPGDLRDPGIALPGRFFTTTLLKNIDIGSVQGKELPAQVSAKIMG